MPTCFSKGLRPQGAGDGQVKRSRGALQSWEVNISRPPEGNPCIFWSLGQQQQLSLFNFRGEASTLGPGSRPRAAWCRRVRSPPAKHMPAWCEWVSRMPSHRGHQVSCAASGTPSRRRSSAKKNGPSMRVRP